MLGIFGAGVMSNNITQWIFRQSYDQRVIVVDCGDGEREIAAVPAIESEKRIDAAMAAIRKAIELNHSQEQEKTVI
jgi:hypothetical protein